MLPSFFGWHDAALVVVSCVNEQSHNIQNLWTLRSTVCLQIPKGVWWVLWLRSNAVSEEPQITFHKCLQFFLYNYIWNRIISTLWKNDNQVVCVKWWIAASLSGGFSSQVKNLSQKVYSKFYRVWIWIVWQDGLSIQSLNPFEFGGQIIDVLHTYSLPEYSTTMWQKKVCVVW